MILLAVGICAVAVILLSHSFYQDQKIATKTTKKGKTEVTIQAPSDVTSQGQIGVVPDQHPSVVKEIVTDERKDNAVIFVRKSVANFFRTLFRVVIAPNAP